MIATQHNATQHNITQHNTTHTKHDAKTQHNKRQHNTSQQHVIACLICSNTTSSHTHTHTHTHTTTDTITGMTTGTDLFKHVVTPPSSHNVLPYVRLRLRPARTTPSPHSPVYPSVHSLANHGAEEVFVTVLFLGSQTDGHVDFVVVDSVHWNLYRRCGS